MKPNGPFRERPVFNVNEELLSEAQKSLYHSARKRASGIMDHYCRWNCKWIHCV